MSDTPRMGRPSTPLTESSEGMPAYSRVLRAGFAARGCLTIRAAADAAGVDERGLRKLLIGRTASPAIDTLAPLLRTIRPDDRDGGWGWFGRQLERFSA